MTSPSEIYPPSHDSIGKTFCLNDRVGTMIEKEEETSEGQAGFRPSRGCVEHVYTLRKIVQGRKTRDERRSVSFWMYTRHMAVWRNGLWVKL